MRNRKITKLVAFAAAFVGFLALSYSSDAWAQVTESTTANDVICSQCVHTSDIKKGAITTNRLHKNAVKTGKIADGAVNSAKILDGSVTGADIANGSVTGTDIATGSVFGSDIANGSLTDTDIANEAGMDGLFFTGIVSLTSSETTIAWTTVTAPSSGYVIINVAGTAGGTENITNRMNCSITTGTSLLSSDRLWLDFTVLQTGFAMTKVFSVSSGSIIYRLVCSEFLGAVQIADVHINAIFVPTRY